ncbi:MAG: hypothetical protein K9J16_00515 [Melioribacteraceae bacterium]|nr:hypothetical protein [Melioribacteraceae bacterium]MCF8354074.1 hypothetical protein [Melioribacteraceae bacterium]MCF8393746.1 hypothetical protein [Melioribacteraceae bacterium]MCF8419490.1 hypothetical protein [Melioribacteraceae bacterium]
MRNQVKIIHKIFLLFLFFSQSVVFPCTSAIVSGKASPNGRPLLWKHRDASHYENKLMFFKGFKYDFIADVNVKDTLANSVWMGSNTAGFSIINTAAYNVDETNENEIPIERDGYVMKKALAECATLADFEALLDTLVGKWGVASNFGVIDAQGGAAYYEVDHHSYKKFDVNDPAIAPDGYLIRTNYAVSGRDLEGHGYMRYETAKKLFNEHYARDQHICFPFILKTADRNMLHSLTKDDVYKMDLPQDTTDNKFIPFRDFIVRYSSISSMIIQGVKPGEDPALTTLWTVLGFPVTTLVTPVWVAAGENLPTVTIGKEGITAPINKKSLHLKEKCFPIDYGHGSDYLNVSALLNKAETGIIQKLFPYEKEIIDKAQTLIKNWTTNSFQKEEAAEYYQWLDEYINSVYQKEFGI